MRLVVAVVALWGAIAACQVAVAPSETTEVEIQALDWISASADPVEHLSRQPVACLASAGDPATRRGELLFNSPLLLGGQAAKAGLSCASCHRNGRGNPEFVFTGISGAPGTADVTNGLFSKIRADGVFNPVPIPDLASAEGRSQVDRDQSGELETFLSAQIIEEFSGVAPSKSVVTDLSAYIRALDEAACDPAASAPQSWTDEMTRLQAGSAYLDAGTATSTRPYRAAMRAGLGRLNARYAGVEHAMLREELVSLSVVLSSDPTQQDISKRLNALRPLLENGAATSLYNPEILAATLP